MKKKQQATILSLLLTAAMTLTACTGAEGSPEETQKQNQTSAEEKKTPADKSADNSLYGTSDIPELTLVDGSKAVKEEILSCKKDGGTLIYEANIAFYVPVGTKTEERPFGKKGSWQKLKIGDKVGDLTVEDIKSAYCVYEKDTSEIRLAEEDINLSGKFSFAGKASYLFDAAMRKERDIDYITISLEDESAKKLFSLVPFDNFHGSEGAGGVSLLITPADKYYDTLKSMLGDSDEEVSVKGETDGLNMRFTCSGLVMDGNTICVKNNITSIEKK